MKIFKMMTLSICVFTLPVSAQNAGQWHSSGEQNQIGQTSINGRAQQDHSSVSTRSGSWSAASEKGDGEQDQVTRNIVGTTTIDDPEDELSRIVGELVEETPKKKIPNRAGRIYNE